ncbi:high mobility group protein 20A-like [Amphibalanus amphitrite]|uniref:high mobility group protein 20A-like n=1 Tax=Amphibalanus amphitrite TaxID=1232801 RepID=UPI001C91C14C|nr:high mobility group protein 20A-like [Amphibalanus amphitrite]
MSEAGPSDKQGRKKGWPRGKKRTLKIKDVNAPKLPMSGYMLFLNDHREQVRAANPGATFSDMTRLLANAWQAAPQEEKQQYMEAAQQQKERYSRELIKYQQTDAYRAFSQQLKAKGGTVSGGSSSSRSARHDKENEKETRAPAPAPSAPAPASAPAPPPPPPPLPLDDSTPLEIPIFTETFLAHNREREAELRQLRRANTEYEEQNATLQKHIDNMREAVERLESETEQQRGQNAALQLHLEQLRALLAERFASVPLPGCSEPLTPETVDTYLAKLHALLLERPQEHQALLSTVRDIVHRLEHQ